MSNIIEKLQSIRAELVAEYELKLSHFDKAIVNLSGTFGGGLQPKPMMRKPDNNKKFAAPIGEKINRAVKTGTAPASGELPSVADAIREVMRGMGKGGKFTGKEMIEKIARAWPALRVKAMNGVSVAMQYLRDKGEVSQDRPGRGCTYTVAICKPPSGSNVTEKEKQWAELRKDIQVPRDVDAGEE